MTPERMADLDRKLADLKRSVQRRQESNQRWRERRGRPQWHDKAPTVLLWSGAVILVLALCVMAADRIGS